MNNEQYLMYLKDLGFTEEFIHSVIRDMIYYKGDSFLETRTQFRKSIMLTLDPITVREEEILFINTQRLSISFKSILLEKQIGKEVNI